MNNILKTMALLLTVGSTAAQAALITFEPFDEQGLTLAPGDVIAAQGFTFTQLSNEPSILFAGETLGSYANNGTLSSLFAGNAASFRLASVSGDYFSLSSFELGGGNLGDISRSTWATGLELRGLTSLGSTLNRTLSINGDSQGLSLVNLGWLDLRSVDFLVRSGDYSVDNVNVSANGVVPVPEPGSFALLGAGLMFLLLGRRGLMVRKR